MNDIAFGDKQFRITVRECRVLEKEPRFSQLEVILAGEGWILHAPDRDETLGIVAGRIADFVASSSARHWGSFVGLGTREEAVDRVQRHVFGGQDPSVGEFHRWEMSAALVSYSLSSLFENGLGVEQAISIRGPKHETLIWRTLFGEVETASVPNEKFDEACMAFVEWANSQMGSGSLDHGQPI